MGPEDAKTGKKVINKRLNVKKFTNISKLAPPEVILEGFSALSKRRSPPFIPELIALAIAPIIRKFRVGGAARVTLIIPIEAHHHQLAHHQQESKVFCNQLRQLGIALRGKCIYKLCLHLSLLQLLILKKQGSPLCYEFLIMCNFISLADKLTGCPRVAQIRNPPHLQQQHQQSNV